MKPITERQLKYLNILLTDCFGDYDRKIYLKVFYKVDSSKNLTLLQASEIIEKFVPDNENRNKEISIAIEKINEMKGQAKLL